MSEELEFCDVRNIKEILGEYSEPYQHICDLVTSATLHPQESIRVAAQHVLRRDLKDNGITLISSFMGDHQLFLNMTHGNEPSIWYICDVPEEYCGFGMDTSVPIREVHKIPLRQNEKYILS